MPVETRSLSLVSLLSKMCASTRAPLASAHAPLASARAPLASARAPLASALASLASSDQLHSYLMGPVP